MKNGPKAPDFRSMEISSMGKRRLFDRGFLVLCLMTSLISIVILAVLLTSIVINSLPTFGAHEDKIQTEGRWLVIQGDNPGNDPDLVDAGDVVQSLFEVETLDRGGLGKSNDTKYDSEQSQRLIGICSYQVESFRAAPDENAVYYQLVPATGERNVVAIAKQLGLLPDEEWAQEIQQGEQAQNATFLLMENPASDFDLGKAKIDGELFAKGLLAGMTDVEGWSTILVGGQQDSNFSTLRFTSMISGESDSPVKAEVIEGLPASKSGGEFKCLNSVLAHNLGSEVHFKPVKLREYGSDEIAVGDVKFVHSKLEGLSRRKKKSGFSLGDEFHLIYCPVPEVNANTAGHIRHFLKETNKSRPEEVGIGPALIGTLWVCLGCALFALPLGIGTAIFLEEFKPTNWFVRMIHSLIQLNITNLAGVPSIVYGILGLTAFAGMFGLFGIAKDPYLEVGAKHYFQYLSEGNKSVLVPVASDQRRRARSLDLVRKRQKRIFRTSVQGIEIPLQINQSAARQHQQFREELASIEDTLQRDDARSAYNKAIEAMDGVIDQLEEPFDRDLLVEAAQKSELALRNLISEVQTPTLVDSMEVFTADFEPRKLILVEDGQELPTDEAELAVTLRSTAVGGPMSKKSWYYFQLPFGRSVLAASLTLMLVILPVIIIASQEALRAVPSSLRECALGLGSTPWQVVRHVTLPAAIPSIMTGAILAMSRAIGEAAPILVICGILFVTTGPTHLMDVFSILPVQIYDLAQLPEDQEAMINAQNVSAAGIVVLLIILLSFNAVAITIRQWTQKPLT